MLSSAVEFMEIKLKNATNDDDVYAPGDIVSGVVHLKLNEPIRARLVQLKFVAKAESEWWETTAVGVAVTGLAIIGSLASRTSQVGYCC